MFNFSLLLALQHLDDEINKVEESRHVQQKVLTMLTQKTTTALLQHTALERYFLTGHYLSVKGCDSNFKSWYNETSTLGSCI